MTQKTQVLVTGANGFVGSHLVEALLARGYGVRCLVRRSSDLAFIEHLPVEWVYGDVSGGEGLEVACAGVQAVCHLAGATKARDRETYFRVNAEGTRRLLETCARLAPELGRFVYVSSLAAAGPSPDGHPIDEAHPPNPLTFYGQSKLQGEQYCHDYMARLPIVMIRPPAVYGPRERDIYFYFQMVNRGIKLLLGRGARRASFVFVADLVSMALHVLEDERAVGQTYFVTEAQDYDWQRLSEMVASALGRRALRLVVPEGFLPVIAAAAGLQARFTRQPALLNDQKLIELRQRFWVCSGEKARRELGFETLYPLEKGIRITAQWYRQNGWL
ncbi:MAG: NAD-dependent epimerase/dehydratase family protein [Chloroflexota bacterium]